MSGLLNQTGAVSGILGTTVGTPATPAGHILQIQSYALQSALAASPSSSWMNLTGLAVTITPASTSNKIFLQVAITGQATTSVWSFFRAARTLSGGATTYIGLGNETGSNPRTRASISSKQISTYDVNAAGWNIMDTPSADVAVTYQLQVIGNGVCNINREQTYADNISTGNFISTVTAWEIKV